MAAVVGQTTEEEILAQPRQWSTVLQEVSQRFPAFRQWWSALDPREIILTGCGSSYYVALAAMHLLAAGRGVPCRALPSSEILLGGDAANGGVRPAVLIAISRSGETTETVWALEHMKQQGVATLALTCHEGGTLSSSSDLSLALPVVERSVVMTGSFTSMLLALAILAAHGAGPGTLDDLARVGETADLHMAGLAAGARQAATRVGRSCVFLGSGPLYGLACEGALKMTEMALVPSCAYHTLEYQHGPKAAISDDLLIVGLLSGQGMRYEERVLRQAADLGAAVEILGGEVDGLPSLPFGAAPGSVPAMLLAAVWMQLLGLAAARLRGVDPDAPRFLDAVVTWEQVFRGGGR